MEDVAFASWDLRTTWFPNLQNPQSEVGTYVTTSSGFVTYHMLL